MTTSTRCLNFKAIFSACLVEMPTQSALSSVNDSEAVPNAAACTVLIATSAAVFGSGLQ